MPLRATTPLVVLLFASPALLCQSAPSSPIQPSPTQVAAASPRDTKPAAGPATTGDNPPAGSDIGAHTRNRSPASSSITPLRAKP